ncbi:MAG: DUF2095 family protein [Candidatus Thorarchaeota archaeon]|nr:DUF2095 family protein [Candidatus Thorarchaeota archaeon]
MSDDDEFSRAFPALTREMREGTSKEYRISGVRQRMNNEQEPRPADKTFYPDVVDYIRRCDTISQAMEIVDYLAKRGEISTSEAKSIKTQLRSEGLRSFGTKKETDHYLRYGLE